MSAPSIEDITRTTIEHKATHLVNSLATINALNQLLYGDERKATRWELFVFRMKCRAERVRDAWHVLTGQAHIGDW